MVYHSAGPASRWDFDLGGVVVASAVSASYGYDLTGTASGAYPTLTVAAQDVYGQRVSVAFSTPVAD